MTEHAPPEEGEGNLLGEEDPADAGLDVREGIADAADNEVLEWRGSSYKGGLFVFCEAVAFV